MYKCWNCGTEHESPASNDAYNRGYRDGYTDAEKHYTQPTVSCGYPIEWHTTYED